MSKHFFVLCAVLMICQVSNGQVVMEVPPALLKIDVTSAANDNGETIVVADEMIQVNGNIKSTEYRIPVTKDFELSGSVEIGYELPTTNAMTGDESVSWVKVQKKTVCGTGTFSATPPPPSNPSPPVVFAFDEIDVTATPAWRDGFTYYVREYVILLKGKNMEDWTEADTLARGTASFACEDD